MFLRTLLAVLGKKGVSLVAVGMFASLMLACAEYCLSSLSVALLSPLIGSSDKLPPSIPGIPATLPPGIILGALLLAIAVRSVCKLAASQSAHVLLQLATLRFRNIQGYELLMTDQGRYLPLSRLNIRFGEFIPKASEFIFFGMNLLVQLLYAAALLAGMLLLSWRETLLAVGLMTILGLAVLRITRLLTAASEGIARQALRLEATIVRISRNWIFIRLMHTVNRERSAFADAAQNYYRQGVRMFFDVNVMGILPQFVGMTSISLLIFIKIHYFGKEGAGLLVFFYLFVRLIQAMSLINDQVGKMGKNWHHVREMFNLAASLAPAEMKDALEYCSDDSRRSGSDATQSENTGPCPDLQLSHVCFIWPGMSEPFFNDLSISISAGSHYGIIGPNGSGKSTLLALMLGVLEPHHGIIRIAGTAPRRFVRERSDLGFVGSDPYLFEGSVFENITYGCRREIAEEEVRSVLETVGLLSTVRQLKGELNARLGEGGEGFSSGEKQRLALGRALLRRPALLVLDEATSNLDSRMERDVVEILRRLHGACTIISVTHRPEMLRYSDGALDLGKLPSWRTS